MYSVLTTKEISLKTGLTDRSVRRRLTAGNAFGPTVMLIKGKQVTYGATVEGVNNWLNKNVSGNMNNNK